MRRRCTATILALGLLLTPACGPREDAAGPTTPLGPPLWQAGSADPGARGSRAHLRARSPCRLEVVLEGFASAGERKTVGVFDLPAGRSVPVFWEVAASEGPERGGDPPPQDAREAGRTDAWRAALTCEIDSRALFGEGALVWTRPGRGQRLLAHAPVPSAGHPEEMPFGGELELACVAIADTESGRAELRQSGEHCRVHVADEGPKDRVRVFRLLLRVEARSNRRSE